jgi:hypothetical protein
MKGWHVRGLDVVARLDALRQQLSLAASTTDSGFGEKLFEASRYISVARHYIQRSVRTPLSLSDVSALSRLLNSIADLMTADGVITALGCPISGPELADTGYHLMDTANEYFVLAQHFYDDEVRAARTGRPSDAVEAEVAAVSLKSASLKGSVMEYLKKAQDVLQRPGPYAGGL